MCNADCILVLSSHWIARRRESHQHGSVKWQLDEEPTGEWLLGEPLKQLVVEDSGITVGGLYILIR